MKVQTRRKSTRSKATPVQNVISHDGVDFGKRPVQDPVQSARFTEERTKDYYLQVTCIEKMERHSPCPNLMQIRSSTMHIARESQQKDPTFLKGFLKTIITKLSH